MNPNLDNKLLAVTTQIGYSLFLKKTRINHQIDIHFTTHQRLQGRHIEPY